MYPIVLLLFTACQLPQVGHTLAPLAHPEVQQEPDGGLKKRCAVFSFANKTALLDSQLGAYASEQMRRGLGASLRVLAQADMRSDMTTDVFLDGDRIKVEQLVREGRRLGVSAVVLGRVSKVHFRRQVAQDTTLFRDRDAVASLEVDAKLFDVQTGRELISLSCHGEAKSHEYFVNEQSPLAMSSQPDSQRSELFEEAIQDSVAQMLPNFFRSLDKMVWRGRIAKVLGVQYVLNAGKASGLTLGDILKVLSQGEDVYDTQNGLYLGRSPGQLKGTLEVLEFVGNDAAIATLHTGGNFQENDDVELY